MNELLEARHETKSVVLPTRQETSSISWQEKLHNAEILILPKPMPETLSQLH